MSRALGWTAVAAGSVAALLAGVRPDHAAARAGRPDAGYLSSRRCLACHPAQHASWSRTFHRTMTQDAGPRSVRGDFERDNTYEYLGVRARMERRGAGFTMALRHPDGREQSFPILRTVGSRRIQQYLTREAGQYVRLPLAWDIGRRRWMSLNGSFFHRDGGDFFQHRALWDTNCVFCHNVKAQPNFDFERRAARTEVAELGIACEACHGPAGPHAQAASSPFTRTLWRTGLGGPPKQVVHPARLDPERSLMVCGHCHGQRVPEPMERIREVLAADPFDAGEDLSAVYRPVWHDTTVGEYSFASRFWADGSPRLTAYEYQGVLRSACFRQDAPRHRMTCLTCHTMHAGDPRGQITAENRTDRPCLSCHPQLAAPASQARHSGHAAESSGSRCYNCHMPRVVYGVMAVHPTHEITVPEPQRTAAQGVPNACSQCHLDRSVNWAIRESARLWPRRFAGVAPGADPQFDGAEGPRALFAGDALARALAAEALGGGGPARPDPRWARPYLAAAFLEDDYPIVRFFAENALMPDAAPPAYLAPAVARRAALERWGVAPEAGPGEHVRRMARALRARRVETDIEVGE